MKTTLVDIGTRIVLRVYHAGGASDVAGPMRRNPAEPVQFGGLKMPRNFYGVTGLALLVDGKQITRDLDFNSELRPGDELWFYNK